MKFDVIINPKAGRGNTERELDNIKNALRDVFQITVHETKNRENAVHLTKLLVDKENFNLIAVGGDGTIHEVVNGIMLSKKRDKVKLGIIPSGSGNDFARELKIPKNYEEAVNLIKYGWTKKIDVGMINDWYFINSVGIGFNAFVTKESYKITKLKGLPLYLTAVIKSLFKYSSKKFTILAGDKTIFAKGFTIEAGNGTAAGGGFYLTPDAELDDGLIDICTVFDANFFSRVFILMDVLKKRHKTNKYVTIWKEPAFKIINHEFKNIHLDGEHKEIEEGTPLNISLINKGITVFAK